MDSAKWPLLTNSKTISILTASLESYLPAYTLVNCYSLPVAFYNNTILLRAELKNREGVTYWMCALCRDDVSIHILDFTNTPIYQYNERNGILINPKTVLPYIDFFFSHVEGSHGFFNILHNAGDLPLNHDKEQDFNIAENVDKLNESTEGSETSPVFNSLPELLNFYIKDLEILEFDQKSGFRVSAYILFKDSIFKAEVLVQPSGFISLQNEQLVLEGIPVLSERIQYIKKAELEKTPVHRTGMYELKDKSKEVLTDEKVILSVYEVLFEDALIRLEKHILFKNFSAHPEPVTWVENFARMVMQYRPVIVFESSQPYIEEIVAKILAREECMQLNIINCDTRQSENAIGTKLKIPTVNNNSLVLLPMHTYTSIEQEERAVFDISTTDSAVLIGSYSFTALPETLQRIADLVIRIPEIDFSNFNRIFTKIFDASLPMDLMEGSLSWVGQVLPTDFQHPLRLELNPAEIINYIKFRVKERNSKVSPDESPSLKDLHGLGEAKEIVLDIISDIDAAIHGKISWDQVDKGLLIVGPPGTGKTTLAKAIAKECGVKFINASAVKWSSTEHLGYHLQAIHADFATARRFAPSILFIDEFDSIGSRENGDDRNNYYQTQIVNALLQEIQGFTPNDKVIIIGATNYEEKIDPSLKRAGRLDHVVHVPYPNIDALTHIYSYYLKPYKTAKQLGNDINTRELAEISFGLTGADVEQFVRNASRQARKEKRKIKQDDLVSVIYCKPRGTEGVLRMDKAEMLQLAVHEAGHALSKILGKQKGRDIAYLSIVPRYDGKLGFVASIPDAHSILTRSDYIEKLEVMLAGRAAEEVYFGPEQVSSGAGGSSDSDLAQATRLLLHMVTRIGFGEKHNLLWIENPGPEQLEEVKKLLDENYRNVVRKIYDHKHLLEKIVTLLLKKQEIRGTELLKLLD